jgi:hypothetical protein
MTTAEFIAACFWPLAGLFALLLTLVRDGALRRYFSMAALGVVFLYLGLLMVYPQSSIVAMIDLYIFAGLLGLACIWYGCVRWRQDRYYGLPVASKETLVVIGLLSGGAVLAGWFGVTLYYDFAQPRLVLEGRAQNLRSGARRTAAYRVDIAGRTVNAVAPDAERLKLAPYVRVKVGRGSNYIFGIEYLAN